MKKNEIENGGEYIAKVSNRLCPIKIIRESFHGGWDAKNLLTERRIRIKTAARLHRKYDRTNPFTAWPQLNK